MLEKWIHLLMRNRLLVIITWTVIAVVGGFSSQALNSHLSTSLTIPHSQSEVADRILSQHFGENIEGTFTVIYHFKKASKGQIAQFEAEIASATHAVPSASVAQSKALGGTLFANIDTSLSLAKASRYTGALRSALEEAGLTGALVTGPPAIQSDVTPILARDLQRGELMGVLVALALLLLVIGFSWQILIPFLFAAGTICATTGLIYLMSLRFLVVLYIPNIVELIGLGLAIDYSLLMIFRYRREMSENLTSKPDAIVRTMASAGRTVRLSGITVTIALATLLVVPIPFIRSLGSAVILVPLVAILAAFTLQPVLLSYLPGPQRPLVDHEKGFSKLAGFIIARPRFVVTTSLLAIVALAFSAYSLHLTPSSLTAVPAQLESQRAISQVTGSAGPGVITPNEVVIDLGRPGQDSDPHVAAAREGLAQYLLKVPEVVLVATGAKSPYVDSTGRYMRIFVIGRHGFGAPQSRTLVQKLRTLDMASFGFPTTVVANVGGAAAQGSDLLQVLGSTFPWIVLLALILTFVLLVLAFHSIVLPVKAILLDLMSLAVAYGIVVASFGSGVISKALGIYHLNQIEAWSCVFLFVLLFGVSMDYEVFMISSIKEARDAGATNLQAIEAGVTRVGVVVTTSALIFVGAVSGLALGHFAGLQELGIGLGFGVLIDATIIRGLLLPSAMVLLGRWNWWMPTNIARLIKTTPTPLDEVRG